MQDEITIDAKDLEYKEIEELKDAPDGREISAEARDMEYKDIEDLGELPGEVKQPQVAATGHQQLLVTWKRLRNVSTYQLEYQVCRPVTMEEAQSKQEGDFVVEESGRIATGFSRGDNFCLMYHHRVDRQDHMHQYRVRAKNRVGWGPFSKLSVPCYAESKAPPREVQIISIESNKPKYMELKWENHMQDRVLEYEMQMQSLPSNKWHRFGSTTSCHFTIKSLQTEVEYRFKIRARNWHGWGPFGDPSEITVCTPGPPAAPDQPICKFDKESSRIEIVWDLRLLAVKTLVGFDIEMSVMNREEHSWEHVRTWRIPPPVTQQKKTSVEDFVVGEWYRFRVRAETIYGLGSWSEPSMILRTVKEEIDVQDAVWEARTQGVVALYKLLRVYPYNPQVVQKCCSALWNILTTKTKATIYDQPDRPSPTVDELVTVLHAVFDGMDEYEEIVDVQRWGIRAISGILHTFLDNDPFPELNDLIKQSLEKIKNALRTFPKNNSVMQWGCEELTTVAAISPQMANYVSIDGGIEILVAALRMNPQNASIHLWAAQALMICMFTNVMSRMEAKREGLLHACDAGIETFADNDRVVDVLNSTRMVLRNSDRINIQTCDLKQARYMDGSMAWILQPKADQKALEEKQHEGAGHVIQRFFKHVKTQRRFSNLLQLIEEQQLIEESQ